MRTEYNTCIDAIQKWLQEVEVKVQDRIILPSQLKQVIIVSLTILSGLDRKANYKY